MCVVFMVKSLKYMNKLYKLMNTDDVKIITGVRRSGKTHLIIDNY